MSEVVGPGEAAGGAGPAGRANRFGFRPGTFKRPLTWVAIFLLMLVAASSCQSFPALGLGPPAPESLLGSAASTMKVRFGIDQLLDPSMRSPEILPGATGTGSALLPEPRKPWLVEAGWNLATGTLLFDYQNPSNYVGLRYFPAYTTWELYQVVGGGERRLHTWLIAAKDVGTLTVARTESEIQVVIGGYQTRIPLLAGGNETSGGTPAAATYIGVASPPVSADVANFYDVRF